MTGVEPILKLRSDGKICARSDGTLPQGGTTVGRIKWCKCCPAWACIELTVFIPATCITVPGSTQRYAGTGISRTYAHAYSMMYGSFTAIGSQRTCTNYSPAYRDPTYDLGFTLWRGGATYSTLTNVSTSFIHLYQTVNPDTGQIVLAINGVGGAYIPGRAKSGETFTGSLVHQYGMAGFSGTYKVTFSDTQPTCGNPFP